MADRGDSSKAKRRSGPNTIRKPRFNQSLRRREFLAGSAGGLAATLLNSWPLGALAAQEFSKPSNEDWDAGIVRHLLPAVNESRMMIKMSLQRPLSSPPRLRIQGGGNTVRVDARMNDTLGQFWQFYVEDLRPATTYELSLAESDGSAMCDSWPLTTFPSPEQSPDRLRLLFYTCAGGPQGNYHGIGDRSGNLPTEIRNRILRRGLSFAPDAAIANGDHIYWDLHT